MTNIDEVLTKEYGINEELTKTARKIYGENRSLTHDETIEKFLNEVCGEADESGNSGNWDPVPFPGKEYIYCDFKLPNGKYGLYVVAEYGDPRGIDGKPVVFNCSFENALNVADYSDDYEEDDDDEE